MWRKGPANSEESGVEAGAGSADLRLYGQPTHAVQPPYSTTRGGCLGDLYPIVSVVPPSDAQPTIQDGTTLATQTCNNGRLKRLVEHRNKTVEITVPSSTDSVIHQLKVIGLLHILTEPSDSMFASEVYDTDQHGPDCNRATNSAGIKCI